MKAKKTTPKDLEDKPRKSREYRRDKTEKFSGWELTEAEDKWARIAGRGSY